ncbi:MAG TPA: response regulator transcription factor [Chloroflexota bacterium]
MKILLVEDDHDLVELLSFALLRAGLWPLPAYTTEQAMDLLATEDLALVILDLHLDGELSLELLRKMRLASDVLIVALGESGAEDDKVRAFEMGADDYLAKPFGVKELLARIRACLRRGPSATELDTMVPLEVGSLRLNPREFSVSRDGQAISLTPTEFRLLHYLMRHAGRVVSSRALMQQLWRDDRPANTDPLRVAIHRLRRKLGDTASPTGMLQSVAGIGIMLKTNAA